MWAASSDSLQPDDDVTAQGCNLFVILSLARKSEARPRFVADASVAELELDDEVLALEVIDELGCEVGD